MRRKRTEIPDEDELLAFLDGELSAERQAEIRELSETDWEVRARLARVQRRIEKYVEATAHHSPADIPSFDDFWLRLSPQLKELSAVHGAAVSPEVEAAENDGPPSLLTRLARLFTPQRRRLRLAISSTAVPLVIAAAIYLLRSDRVGVVSAQELLQRSAQAEVGRASRVTEPVVYRRLQVRRRTASGVDSLAWESWDDAARSRFRQRVADRQGLRFLRGNETQTPALLAELERTLARNRMDAQRPLSAASYARWREQIQRKAESVMEVVLPDSMRETGLKLVTVVAGPHAPDTIIEASLVVRRSDWHAVAQHLKVQGINEIREYELGELAYEVLPSQALTVFSDLAPVVATPAALPSRISASPAPPLPSPSVLPTAAALIEAETAALYALHQAQADLGEQIEVLREANKQIVVQGLVETEARKQQLTEALYRLPLVAVRLQSVEEIVRQTAQQSTQEARPAEVVPASEPARSAAPGRSAFEKRLAQYFAAQGESRKNTESKIAELSNAVVAERAAALAEAWALRRLAERFSAAREGEITPASRQRIEEMLSHHVARLRERTRALRGRLEPVLVAIAGGNAALPPLAAEPDWQTQALMVFKSVEQVHQLAGRLFASADGMAETPEQAARQILEAIARLDGALEAFERQITR
jgi:anti-sigma factor RsiW